MNGHVDPFERHSLPPPLPPPPAPSTIERTLRSRGHGLRPFEGFVQHAVAVAGGSVLGLMVFVGGMLAIIGEQMAYDDSSGASGSQPPAVLGWFLFAIAGLSLLAAVGATVGSIVGLVRHRRERGGRGVGYLVSALLLAAPGTAIVVFALVAWVVVWSSS